MSTRRIVLQNASWNSAGMILNMAAGFLVAPFLVRRLGETGYGLWILIASFTSYFGMLDLGVRGAVGRQVAFRRAQGDVTGINSILSTSLAILSIGSVIALLTTLVASSAITRFFDVPAEQIGPSRLALILVGLNFALWLPLCVFDGILWASQRFDLLNRIDLTATLLRTALTFLLIGRGGGLVTLACLNLITMSGAQAAKGIAAAWDEPRLRARWGLVRGETARELFGYGIWNSLISASRTLTTQASPLVIGASLGIRFVTPFSIASRLVGYAGALIVSGTGVLTPVATAIHAEGAVDRQKRLFVEGGKYCMAMALGFAAGFLFLGRPLITFWMGPELASSAVLLAILTLGEVLPMSQWVTQGVILGMSRHRPLAMANLSECAIAATLAVVLAKPLGLVGICIGFALPAFLCRGVFLVLYGCHLVGISPGQYLASVFAPAIKAAALPTAALGMAVLLGPPRTTPRFLVYCAAYGLAYLASAMFFLIGFERLESLRGKLTERRSDRPPP